ncbi:hypothetical protein OBBRIDRAFT_793795 [Obba rivulosa]|uniref:Uncharacterized protein n=1 Tax=Obba rivulosa TaxID=1052685 RepID=A0A8E2ASV2_9APHY|nr:hypothetical protein OBBRIDRAFT_793795 [Obba rivulosa]
MSNQTHTVQPGTEMPGLVQNGPVLGASTQSIGVNPGMQRSSTAAAPDQEVDEHPDDRDPRILFARMEEFVMYSMLPTQELDACGMPEAAIDWIESHRAVLQSTWHQQQDRGRSANGQRPVGMESRMLIPFNRLPRRPTAQEEQQGVELVARVKADTMNRITNMPMCNVPDSQRLQFNAVFEQAGKLLQEIEPKLYRFACLWKAKAVCLIISMVLAAKHQQHLLAMTPPRYCLELQTIRTIVKHFQAALEQCNVLWASLHPENH